MTFPCLISVALAAVVAIAKCTAHCPQLISPANGHIRVFNSRLTALYSCEEGFYLQGKAIRKCNDGIWEKSPPLCLPYECASLRVPEFANVTCAPGALTIGTTCSYQCTPGYILRGRRTRTCHTNFKWSGKEPSCVLKTRCPIPPNFEHGTVLGCSTERPPTTGKICKFECYKGYELRGPHQLICRANGKLTDFKRQERSPRCVDVNECLTRNLNKCSHRCHNTDGGFYCSCPIGYLLNKYDCKVPNACQIKNGYCSQICKMDDNDQPQCSCYSGYQLSPDERTCIDIKRIYSEEQRLVSPPTVVNGCRSMNGYCSQICNTNDGRTSCSCYEGYELSITDNKLCIDINECSKQDLHRCQHKCINMPGTYRCSCFPGYRLIEKYKCVDIDECSSELLNKCHHKCHNVAGRYTCSCLPGFLLIDGFQCKGCRKNSYQTNTEKFCLDCPANSHTESEGKSSIADCLCLPGFIGNLSQNIPCKDINECEDGNFGCSHNCVNVPGGAHCSCPVGLELKSENKSCADVDECSIKNGGCHGFCHNTMGSFECNCSLGYTISMTDSISCNDIDECAQNNGGCNQKCVNFPGGYYCSCLEGYRLDNTQQNCFAVHCPRVPTPHNSVMRCHIEERIAIPSASVSNNSSEEEFNDYPVGTICTLKCNRGFKSSDLSHAITCQNDGQWGGMMPSCKALQCSALSAPKNGSVHPPSCLSGNISIKQKCYFTCHQGYHLRGSPVFTCKNNRTWSENEIPSCVPNTIAPFLLCPEDITVELPIGQRSYFLTVKSPETNADRLRVTPDWVLVGKLTEFPAGKTNVVWTANNVVCTVTVDVKDLEPPAFSGCPDTLHLETAGTHEVTVDWTEPEAVDNVGVASLTKNRIPNSTLTSGVHNVVYNAVDFAGNIASCSFLINITRIQCSVLKDPAYGEANCIDWLTGKLCNPTCEDGYMRNPDEPSYYICDDFGIWNPSDVISPCLAYFPESTVGCQDGFESVILEDTGGKNCSARG